MLPEGKGSTYWLRHCPAFWSCPLAKSLRSSGIKNFTSLCTCAVISNYFDVLVLFSSVSEVCCDIVRTLSLWIARCWEQGGQSCPPCFPDIMSEPCLHLNQLWWRWVEVQMEFFYGFYLKVASSPAVHFMEDSLAGIHVSMHNLSSSWHLYRSRYGFNFEA